LTAQVLDGLLAIAGDLNGIAKASLIKGETYEEDVVLTILDEQD
jgi:hypothetical protein